jgi:hypothetical protein
LCARAEIAAPRLASHEFMFMPAGVHTVNVSRAGKPVQVEVLVDRATATSLQSQLRGVRARSAQRPFFDFNHDDKDASFWPSEFFWRDWPEPGVYVRGDWSQAGRAAVEGKMYRAFSPVFHVDNVRGKPARVIANAEAGLNFGGLVNKPAFHSISPLWAKNPSLASGVECTIKKLKVGSRWMQLSKPLRIRL